MNGTIKEVIEFGKRACMEHGFSFISIYEARSESNVADGWDRFIISPYHISDKIYKYLGLVRKDGSYELLRSV